MRMISNGLSKEEEIECHTLDATFGQKPNLKNLHQFFRREIIQKLWLNHKNGFRSKNEIQTIIMNLDQLNKEALFRQAEYILPKNLFSMFV